FLPTQPPRLACGRLLVLASLVQLEQTMNSAHSFSFCLLLPRYFRQQKRYSQEKQLTDNFYQEKIIIPSLITLHRHGAPLWPPNPPRGASISVTLSICEFVAGVSATLNYENEEKVPLEAFFVFPMDEDSAVYSFEAVVDGKKIMAELQDKMKAHTNYENAISQGHQAFLLEEDMSSRDVFLSLSFLSRLFDGRSICDGEFLPKYPRSSATNYLNSVNYSQHTMEEALRRVKLMQADLGGTEILTPLQAIYRGTSIPGHPLQLFVFTDGEVTDTFSVIKEVRSNSLKHRCFSFGIGEGASTSLIKGIARVAGGTSEFITGKERIQSKALRALKRSLQPVVEDVSLSWDLPQGLSAKMLSPEQTVIFRGQRLIVYAQLTGMIPPAEATGEVCLKYTLQGKSFENNVTFPLQPQLDANFTIHRLAAKSFLQTKDMGFRETPANDKKDVLKVSIECGVISSHTAFVAINKDLNKPVQGPLAHRDIPRPILCGAFPVLSRCHQGGLDKTQALGHRLKRKCMPLKETSPEMERACSSTSETNLETHHTVFGNNHLVQLISLQKADGSWDLNESLAMALGMSLEDILAALPVKNVDSSSWATVLAVLWLHTNGKDSMCEWELLERKAVAWIRFHAGSIMHVLVKAAVALLKSTVDPAIFTF
ncbi:hypothetical protein HPG69_019483, partial [Diceros bicornis minor]